jgi:hypothetical protein
MDVGESGKQKNERVIGLVRREPTDDLPVGLLRCVLS